MATSVTTRDLTPDPSPPPVTVDPATFRPSLEEALAAIDVTDGGALLATLKGWLSSRQEALKQQFYATNDAEATVYDRCRLIDALLLCLSNLAADKLFPRPNPTDGERLALLAVGGYGRAELAPHSDIDLLFLHPYKVTAHTEKLVEFLSSRDNE
jgi:[protein-PII] uridylyltransferase